MKYFTTVLIIFLMVTSVISETNLKFDNVLEQIEINPQIISSAKKMAIEQNLPIRIYIPEELFAYPAIIENNQVLYAVIKDIHNPFKQGYLSTIFEIKKEYNLKNAEVNYYNDTINLKLDKKVSKFVPGDSLYLVCESSNDRVMAFDAGTGDLVDENLIPRHTTNDTIYTPIEALYSSVRNSILISDQVKDVVQEFDTAGIYLGPFAPKGGQATDTLDNVRGIDFHPNGNLLVSTAGGANSDAIVEFDMMGNFVRNFIVPNASIVDSPFDVLTRSGDILIPALTNEVIARYDFSGNFLDYFATNIDFPEQIAELSNGEIAVANFGTINSGVQIYPDSGGSYTQLLNGVTGVRGVAELDNGNIMTTNGAGIYEVDRTTGSLVRTIYGGVQARFISLYVVGQSQAMPMFSVNPSTIDFGIVLKDSSKTEMLYVKNTGTADLNISAVISDNNDFVVTPDTGLVAQNDSLLFEVTFTAGSDSGIQNANIIFTHDAQSSPDTVSVMANVVTGLNRNININPKTYNLFQNYPNPFNPITNIKFSVPVSENVTLKIYNLKGQVVDTIIKKRLVAGEYSFKYNASELPSGIYIYSMQAGNYKQSNKMILIK